MGLFRNPTPPSPLPMAEPQRTRASPPRSPTHPPPHRETQDGVRTIHYQPKKSPTAPSRHGLVRTPSVQTRYMNMLLAIDQIPRFYNILAACSTWLLLAGYLVFPSTFTSLSKSDVLNTDNGEDAVVKKAILKTVKNAPFLWIAGACCIIGGAGMVWLWVRWRDNYVWLINRIFL
jgi:hypothetical protein